MKKQDPVAFSCNQTLSPIPFVVAGATFQIAEFLSTHPTFKLRIKLRCHAITKYKASSNEANIPKQNFCLLQLDNLRIHQDSEVIQRARRTSSQETRNASNYKQEGGRASIKNNINTWLKYDGSGEDADNLLLKTKAVKSDEIS